jgi:hypothetical protein
LQGWNLLQKNTNASIFHYQQKGTFTRTLIIWKNGTKESGGLTCCQISAGVIRDVPETNYKQKSMDNKF